MLVGSMAGNYWGVPRSTHDIDFVVEYDETQIVTIVKAFEDHFFIQPISVASGLRPPYQFNALDNRSALKVDFFKSLVTSTNSKGSGDGNASPFMINPRGLRRRRMCCCTNRVGTKLAPQIDNSLMRVASILFQLVNSIAVASNIGQTRSL